MKKTQLLAITVGCITCCASAGHSEESAKAADNTDATLHATLPATVGSAAGSAPVLPLGTWVVTTPILVTSGNEVLDGTDTAARKNGDLTKVIPRLRLTTGMGHDLELSMVAPVLYSTHSDRGSENYGNLGDTTVTVRREIFRQGAFGLSLGGGFVLPTGEADGNNLLPLSNEQWQATLEVSSTYFWGDRERNRVDVSVRELQPLGEGADNWKSGYVHRIAAAYAYAINDWLDIGYESYWLKTGEYEYNDQGVENGTESLWHGPKIALKNVLPLKGSVMTLGFQLPAYQWADGNNIFSTQANAASQYEVSFKLAFLL